MSLQFTPVDFHPCEVILDDMGPIMNNQNHHYLGCSAFAGSLVVRLIASPRQLATNGSAGRLPGFCSPPCPKSVHTHEPKAAKQSQRRPVARVPVFHPEYSRQRSLLVMAPPEVQGPPLKGSQTLRHSRRLGQRTPAASAYWLCAASGTKAPCPRCRMSAKKARSCFPMVTW